MKKANFVEKSTVSKIAFPPIVNAFVFRSLTMMGLGMAFWGVTLYQDFPSFLNLQVSGFGVKFEKYSAIISLNIFFSLTLFSTFSGTPVRQMLELLLQSHTFLMLHSFSPHSVFSLLFRLDNFYCSRFKFTILFFFFFFGGGGFPLSWS